MEQKSMVLSAAYLWLHQTLGLYILLGEKLISDRSGGAGREERLLMRSDRVPRERWKGLELGGGAGEKCYKMFGQIERLAA